MIEESLQNGFFDTEYLKSDLKGRSVRGGAVTMAAQGVTFFLRMGSTVVLARLLTPQDFGLIAMVTAVTGFVMMFKDMGLSMATVQRAEINHAQISTLFWINVCLSLCVMVVIAALAPVIAWFYGEPRLTGITLALAAAFIFSGLAIQHQALLRRQMRFGTLAVIGIISMLAGIVAAIISAWYGAGYWSLVLMHLVGAIVATIGVWFGYPWRPQLPRRYAGVKEMLVFGGNVTGFNFVNYFARNADNILIGKFLGSGPLGFYSKAYNLLLLPIRQINNPISAVAVPAMSRLSGDHTRYRDYYLRALFLICFITMPLIMLMIVMARDIILLVLGPQWIEASRVFAVLGVCALVQPIYNTQGWLHISSGHADRYFKWGLVGSTVIVASFLVGIPFGIIGVAVAYSIAIYVILGPCMWYAGKSGGIKLKDILFAVMWPFMATLISGSLTFGTIRFASFEGIISRLLCSSVMLFSVYIVVLLLLSRSFKPLRELLILARHLKREKLALSR